MTASPHLCHVPLSSGGCCIPLCPALLSPWAAPTQLGGDGTHPWGGASGTGSDGTVRPERVMKQGRCPREGWGALGALCSSRGVRGEHEGDVASLEMADRSCPSMCHPAPYRCATAGYRGALYLDAAAEAKTCIRIKAQSGNRQESIDTSLLSSEKLPVKR